MTKEFKVGMTGKTTKGYDWSIHGDRGGPTDHVLRIVTYSAARTIVDRDWITSDGRGYCAEQEFGDLIHPDDAKEEGGTLQEAVAELGHGHPLAGALDRHMRFHAACAALTGILASPYSPGDFLRSPIVPRLTFGKWVSDQAALHADQLLATLAKDKTND